MNTRNAIITIFLGLLALAAFLSIAAIAVPNFTRARVVSGTEWPYANPDGTQPMLQDGVTFRDENGRIRYISEAWDQQRAKSFSDYKDIAALLIICVTFVIILFLRMYFNSMKRWQGRRELGDEESEMLQGIWDGLQKMEDRIMNLETILLDRRRESFSDRPRL